MLLLSEIEEEYDVNDVKVFTPLGWRYVTKVYKTVPLEVWELKTETHSIKCSGHHLVLTSESPYSYLCIEVQHIKVGINVKTDTGIEKVVSVRNTHKKENLYDITVEGAFGLFYSDGICSHNSTTICARHLINSQIYPGYKSLYVAPLTDHVKTYANRYIEMEGCCRGAAGIKQNKYSKVYADGSAVEMLHCLESANAARGKSVWECLIDETLGMDASIIPELLKTLSLSQTPMTIYAGTALSVDTLLETMWQKSSMGMWHIRSYDNKHWLNMYDSKTLSDVCDNPMGPQDPYTGKLLDVTQGCFVHANQSAYAAGDIGIHVPQCIIKENAENAQQWGQIYKDFKTLDFKKVLLESFGIATSEGAREISQKELEEMCVLAETKAQTMEKIKRGYYPLIVSGCDWGGSDYNPQTKTKASYTVHVVLGLAPDGATDILHMKKYSGMDYGDIAADIMYYHKEFRARVIATDAGVGAFYNSYIRQYVPWQQHFIMLFTGPKAKHVLAPVKDSLLANHWALNKTEAVSSVFDTIKHHKMRAKPWEETAYYLTDFLNVTRAPIETPSGETTFKWIAKPLSPNDTLMAIAFCFVLIKLFMGQRIVEDLSLRQQIMATLLGQPMPSVFNMMPRVISG